MGRGAQRPFVITVDSSSLRASQEHCWRTVSKAAGAWKAPGGGNVRWEGRGQAERIAQAGDPRVIRPGTGQRASDRARSRAVPSPTQVAAARCCCRWRRTRSARAARGLELTRVLTASSSAYSNLFWPGLTSSKHTTGVMAGPWFMGRVRSSALSKTDGPRIRV